MKKKVQLPTLLILALVTSPLGPVLSQTSSQSSQQESRKIRIETAEVVLDVVVKDRKGSPVMDLRVDDFEVFEDGVKQPIESFKLVTRSSAGKLNQTKETSPIPSTADARPAEPGKLLPVEKRPDPEVGVSVVALVFDRLSPEARKRAQDAAMSYLSDNAELSSFTGVFAIDLTLYTLQNYTTDLELVKKAIERAASMASASFDTSLTRSGMNESPARRESVTGTASSSAQTAGASGSTAAAIAVGGAAALAAIDQQFEMMQARTQETFEVLQRDQQGYATTNGLMAIVNSMHRLPGRKAVIFFSEGIAIPPNVVQHFRSVINAANRANVSIYAVDAAGLRAESPLQMTRDEINARARRRMETLDQAFRDTSGPLTKGLERNEDLLSFNPQSGLTQLALQTGGEFIGDTNKIGPKLNQIDQELNTFYLLSYSPTNQVYDGRFRNISVKVKRSGLDVRSRKGYYAVPPTGSSPLFYYEALPLAALNNPSKPKDFTLLVGSLHFPEAGRLGRTAVEVEAPANAFTFALDKEKKLYSTDFSFVVLIKDRSKQVVDKLSHHYVLVGPLDALDSVKKGKILFYRETNLPPGQYDVEAVAYDALNNKAAVNQCRLEVMGADESKLRLSDITIIRHAEQVKEKIDNPFLIGDQLLVYPNLGEPIRKAARQMGFYFNVYLAKGSTEPPKLTLEVLQNNKSLARVLLKLAAPDKQGRIQYASALPLESFSPGNYELKISVSDAQGAVSRTTSFILEP